MRLKAILTVGITVAVVACGPIVIPPCVLDGTCLPTPSPSPSPSPSPVPSSTPPPTPAPIIDCRTTGCPIDRVCRDLFDGREEWQCAAPETPLPASPVPSPSAVPPTPPPASPTPVPPTPPPSDDQACVLGPDGNYPMPPIGTCPACWRADPNLISYWGIALRTKIPCSGPKCPYGFKYNVDITPHSAKPYLRHRQWNGGGGTDTWDGCQPCGDPANPECRAAIPAIWVYPPNAEPGLCDPFSGSLYWCHHKPQAGQGGPTKFEVHAPPFRSIVVQVP